MDSFFSYFRYSVIASQVGDFSLFFFCFRCAILSDLSHWQVEHMIFEVSSKLLPMKQSNLYPQKPQDFSKRNVNPFFSIETTPKRLPKGESIEERKAVKAKNEESFGCRQKWALYSFYVHFESAPACITVCALLLRQSQQPNRLDCDVEFMKQIIFNYWMEFGRCECIALHTPVQSKSNSYTRTLLYYT